ncbi:MAG: hypothetical protein M1541_01050, partial [Acidobacteria bacterium]|nr:hypothetical protein [Acidobacteriota bacterium]
AQTGTLRHVPDHHGRRAPTDPADGVHEAGRRPARLGAQSSSLGYAISMTAGVYLIAAALLFSGVFLTVKKDAARMEAELAAEAEA